MQQGLTDEPGHTYVLLLSHVTCHFLQEAFLYPQGLDGVSPLRGPSWPLSCCVVTVFLPVCVWLPGPECEAGLVRFLGLTAALPFASRVTWVSHSLPSPRFLT